MPIGMPGWPDFAASTASMASARMEFASSASVALAVTGESMGSANYTQRLYGTALLDPARVRARRCLRRTRRGALVRVPRRRARRGDGTAAGAERRSARQGAPGVGKTAVAEKPRLVGAASRQNAISRHARRPAVLGGGAGRARRGARGHRVGRAARAL